MVQFFIRQLLLAIDQLINVLFGGYADETMSLRTNTGVFGRPWSLCSSFIFFDLNHCRDAYEGGLIGRQLSRGFKGAL